MRRLVLSVAVLFASLVSAAASAQIRTDAVAKLSYVVPAGLKAKTTGAMVTLGEPKKELTFVIIRTNETDEQKAMAQTDATLSSIFKDVKSAGAPARIKHNGMDAVQMRGTGTYEGKPANVMVMVVKTPANKFVVIAGAVAQAKRDAWKDAFRTFVESIKPAK